MLGTAVKSAPEIHFGDKTMQAELFGRAVEFAGELLVSNTFIACEIDLSMRNGILDSRSNSNKINIRAGRTAPLAATSVLRLEGEYANGRTSLTYKSITQDEGEEHTTRRWLDPDVSGNEARYVQMKSVCGGENLVIGPVVRLADVYDDWAKLARRRTGRIDSDPAMLRTIGNGNSDSSVLVDEISLVSAIGDTLQTIGNGISDGSQLLGNSELRLLMSLGTCGLGDINRGAPQIKIKAVNHRKGTIESFQLQAGQTPAADAVTVRCFAESDFAGAATPVKRRLAQAGQEIIFTVDAATSSNIQNESMFGINPIKHIARWAIDAMKSPVAVP